MGGVAGVEKIVVIRGHCDIFTSMVVVIDLVVTSSNNACLCSLNGVAV